MNCEPNNLCLNYFVFTEALKLFEIVENWMDYLKSFIDQVLCYELIKHIIIFM